MLEKSDNDEPLRVGETKVANEEGVKKVDNEEKEKADEKVAGEVRKLQDMDVTLKKKRQEKGVDPENEYMLKVWEETAKEAS